MRLVMRIIGFGSLVGAVMTLMTSCELQRNEDCEYGFSEGMVVYAGAPEVDGCGWLIKIDTAYYHPVNLSVDFQLIDLPILVKFVSDPEEFRCGRGGVGYPSIRISDIRKNATEVEFLKEDEFEKYSMDPYQMDSAYVDGDWLRLRVSYGGGCRDHEFHLWKLPPNALEPPPVELALSHEDNDDMCDAYFTRWLTFSLVPLQERGKSEVTFLLRGSPEMSAYFGKFTYRY